MVDCDKLLNAPVCSTLSFNERMEPPSTNIPDGPFEGPPLPEDGLLRRQSAKLQARLQPIVQMAEAIIGKVRWQAVLTGGAGLWLWALLFYPFTTFGRVWVVVLGVVVLGLLLAPAGVLGLFWAGLRQLIRVPDKLLAVADEGEVQTGALVETVGDKTERRKLRRLWRFFRTVLNLRALLLESKELLFQFAVVARVANPVFIGVLFVSFVLSLLLIFIAAVSVLVVVF